MSRRQCEAVRLPDNVYPLYCAVGLLEMLRRRSSSRKELTPKQILKKFLDFLNSSIWALPVATFIEQKSTIFDRAYGEQAQPEYFVCFKEFNGLVTTLIECFCGDVNIELPKFREAIGTLSQQRLSRQQRANLEPVAASTDFEVFVPMMMRKNLELQLQALQMIEYLCGVIPQALMLQEGESFKDKNNLSAEDTERYVLISVLRQSKEDFNMDTPISFHKELQLMAQSGQEERQRIEEQVSKESQLMETAIGDKPLNVLPIENSVEQIKTAEIKHQDTLQEVKIAEIKHQAAVHSEKEKADTKPPVVKRSDSAGRSRATTPSRNGPTERRETDVGESRAASAKRKNSLGRNASTTTRAPLNDIRRPSLPNKPPTPPGPAQRPESPGMEHGPRRKNIHDVNALLKETERLSTADVESRRQYLKQQRDKLLEMKQQEREKQLHEVTTRIAQERPRTAKAARGAMRGANPDLLARRNLMDKLKTEITEIHPAD